MSIHLTRLAWNRLLVMRYIPLQPGLARWADLQFYSFPPSEELLNSWLCMPTEHFAGCKTCCVENLLMRWKTRLACISRIYLKERFSKIRCKGSFELHMQEIRSMFEGWWGIGRCSDTKVLIQWITHCAIKCLAPCLQLLEQKSCYYPGRVMKQNSVQVLLSGADGVEPAGGSGADSR